MVLSTHECSGSTHDGKKMGPRDDKVKPPRRAADRPLAARLLGRLLADAGKAARIVLETDSPPPIYIVLRYF